MRELTLNETIILLAILRLQRMAYGVTIRNEVAKISRRKVAYGTLYSYLNQLFRKGYVTKAFGASSADRGGRSTIIYQVSPDGLKALETAYKLQKSVCCGVEEYLADKA
jgi:DNA-binding PadR family transcriptional regulator